MDFQQTKTLLNKLNHLFATIETDEQHIAAVERDLMLSYIRQLYEAILTPTPAKTPPVAPVPIREVQLSAAPAPATVPMAAPMTVANPVVTAASFQPAVMETLAEAPSPAPIAPPMPAPPAPVPPEAVSPPLTAPVLEPAIQPAATVPAAASIEATTTTVSHSSAEAPASTYAPRTATKSYALLFEFREPKEISEKLSFSPIADLRKAIGLNEKMLVAKELFGGDMKMFEEAVNSLNSFTNFDDAKEFMCRFIIEKYRWEDELKLDAAKGFIKLVRRRYR